MFFKKNKNSYTLIVDSSFCQDTGASGWAYWIKGGDMGSGVIHSKEGGVVRASHIAEFTGVVEGVKHAIHGGILPKYAKVLVQCDCLAVGGLISKARCVAKSPKYKVPSKFPDEKELTVELGGLVKGWGLELEYKHVAGHKHASMGGRFWCNIEVDKRAKEEMKKVRYQIKGEVV